MRPTIVLMAVVCWSTPCTLAAAQTQCVSFSDTIDGVNKDRAVEKLLKSLDEQIEKWKADNGVTGACDRNCGETAAASLLAKLRSILCTTATRCRERLLRTRSAGPVWFRPWSAPQVQVVLVKSSKVWESAMRAYVTNFSPLASSLAKRLIVGTFH